ncbi:MAG: SPOR domain-containing protein, partial [Pseudophaeobacter sp.]
MPKSRPRFGLAVMAVSVLALSACEDGANLGFLKPKPAETAVTGSSRTQLVERDVEAPDVFQVNEAGLWDGRPSLGGVWVAHPDAKDPERVIIRNTFNGKFVIGALFRREREIPGPRLQISSDAAAAL